MIKIKHPLNLDLENLTVGQNVTDHVENGVRPVEAIVINPCGPVEDMPIVEIWFVDEKHAFDWMSTEGISAWEWTST